MGQPEIKITSKISEKRVWASITKFLAGANLALCRSAGGRPHRGVLERECVASSLTAFDVLHPCHTLFIVSFFVCMRDSLAPMWKIGKRWLMVELAQAILSTQLCGHIACQKSWCKSSLHCHCLEEMELRRGVFCLECFDSRDRNVIRVGYTTWLESAAIGTPSMALHGNFRP